MWYYQTASDELIMNYVLLRDKPLHFSQQTEGLA